MSDDVAVILLAAGRSERMGGEDKLWADLHGEPVVAWSLRALARLDGVGGTVVVAPSARFETLRAFVDYAGLGPMRLVEGGPRRQDSVAAGIAVAPEARWYLVHDAARPLVSRELAKLVLAAARKHGAAVPVVPVHDTIKRVEDGRVVETIDRAPLRAVQTPQAFAAGLLQRAHAEVRADATDDASMLEQIGVTVATVDGDPVNLKLTTPADLLVARALLAARGDAGTHEAAEGAEAGKGGAR
ncbi:MAG: 2-C-methyl-D-erythritol 4-phosphate cytidylyltransferase [Dehalococcoidia bacterium]|nr:2-C-methyl-D-erythritol 4-phosphate cytidylyltransferase [Dehalococcoidia bacterium]